MFARADNSGPGKHCRGLTVIEAVVAIGIIGFLFVAIYSGITAGIRALQMSRENVRATQILVEKMEGIRLFSWRQVTTNGFIPTYFSQRYFSNSVAGASGVTYHGRITVTNAPFNTIYSSNMVLVNVELSWTSASGIARRREINTLVSRYGLQNYLF